LEISQENETRQDLDLDFNEMVSTWVLDSDVKQINSRSKARNIKMVRDNTFYTLFSVTGFSEKILIRNPDLNPKKGMLV